MYGLCEINREKIRKARLVANPGCYPTCSFLSVYPLVKEGLIDPNTLIIDAKSGDFWRRARAKVNNLFCEVNENIKAYGGQHTVIRQRLRSSLLIKQVLRVTINFTPHLIPMNRGILVTAYASVCDRGISEKDLRDVYNRYYEKEYFVRVLDADVRPETRWVEGSNYVDVKC